MELNEQQRALIELPVKRKIFLEGLAGGGKTTAGVHRLRHLLNQGVPANDILVLVPQYGLAEPYDMAVRGADVAPGGQVDVFTLGRLALEMVRLFYPLVARDAEFPEPERDPTFLTLETAQYTMAHLVRPLIDKQGYFSAVKLDRNRLYSQIIDNLNKAALNEFSHEDIGDRLKTASLGDEAQQRMFGQVQECAEKFRKHCLEHSLLDFSLQVELFIKHLWRKRSPCRAYLTKRYKHLIVDNIEEDTPVTHHILTDWLKHKSCESALVIFDADAGYRRFLSANPDSAYELRDLCKEKIAFDDSLVMSPNVTALGAELSEVMGRPLPNGNGDGNAALGFEPHRYYPEMLAWVADEIGGLVLENNVPPDQIVVLSPFLSDALRFTLMQRLDLMDIPARSHRPSRSLREEPATRCLLTLAQLAHPEWNLTPTPYDVAYTLMQAIGDIEPGEHMDLVRAQLLARAAYPFPDAASKLAPFDRINGNMQSRITYIIGERYDGLRRWIEDYIEQRAVYESGKRPRHPRHEDDTYPEPIELDHFFSLMFGEVLSQFGFGFHEDLDAAHVAGSLVDSARNFRRAVEDKNILHPDASIGQEYVRMVSEGVIANSYPLREDPLAQPAVLIAPAYTFLLSNEPVDYQFWLDIGSGGWTERLYQPLTHPYVLSKDWKGTKWTDIDEQIVREDNLYAIMMGLARRCRHGIYLGVSELGESGYESQGDLLGIIQRMLRRLAALGKA